MNLEKNDNLYEKFFCDVKVNQEESLGDVLAIITLVETNK